MLAGGGVTAAGLAAAVIFSERSKIGIITGVILMLAGLVGLLFGSVESRSAKKMPAGIDEAKERADKDRETADRLKAGLEKLRADIDNIREQLQKAELNLKNAEAEVKETTVERNGILERKAELEADLKEAAENVEKERSNILAELDKAGYLQENGDLLTYLEKISAEQTDAIKSFEAKRRELEAALTEKHRELARIEGTLQRYGDIGERIDEASKHLDEVRARKEELTNELEAVKTAASAIKEISDDFKAGFDRKINDLLGKACGLITSGKYTKARITGDCEPQVMGDSGYIPVRALSVGAAEQVFLAFRLAMAEFIFENEEIPLIFDEVFAYYDDNRLRAALEALSKLKGCQIFLFACSGRERKILDGSGIGYYQIRL
ncbi:MAG: hypothetical protein J6Y89_09985, partial [Lachnospiraceae bacterium]|nr:hypothetical protein [Lachnospiraceae bacterium]